jgi:hypothetical protein
MESYSSSAEAGLHVGVLLLCEETYLHPCGQQDLT